MRAVLRHELQSHFSSLTAYVFGAFLLLFCGIYTMAYNLQNAYTNFEYVLASMCFVFLIIVPILTMRVLAEERRQKTDQLLYSLPLTMTQIVLGKYLALLVIFLVPMGIIALYPLVLSSFGNVYLPAAYSAWAGFFFMGAALLAIGVYVSSVTENQAVAAGVCFVVMLVNYFIGDLASFVSTDAFTALAILVVLALVAAVCIYLMTKNGFATLMSAAVMEAGLMILYLVKGEVFEGLVPEVMENLSIFDRFYDIIDGVFDVTTIIYFMTIAGLFLFLSVQSMEKRRWSE